MSTAKLRAAVASANAKCTKTTSCVVRGCRKRIHCEIKSGHKTGHRFGSHASQH